MVWMRLGYVSFIFFFQVYFLFFGVGVNKPLTGKEGILGILGVYTLILGFLEVRARF
jgi:hypothetical protein